MNAVAFTIENYTYTNRDVYEIATEPEAPAVIYDLALPIKDYDDPIGAADMIASAFKPYGPIIIDSEWWFYQNQPMTLLDVLDAGEVEDPVCAWLLIRSFQKVGFKFAAECNISDLRRIYAQHEYGPYSYGEPHDISMRRIWNTKYKYEDIQAENANLHKDLIDYIYHPSRIQKWIEADNDIEDYLQ